jgi:hypothetical protein
MVNIELRLGSGPNSCFPSTTTLNIKIHLSTPNFLNATLMALLDSSKQTTPPASIVDGPPTPPLTADGKPSGRVAAIFRAFKSCKNGYPPSVPWTVYNLDSGEYEDLQRRLKDDVELCGYVDDKVKLVINK